MHARLDHAKPVDWSAELRLATKVVGAIVGGGVLLSAALFVSADAWSAWTVPKSNAGVVALRSGDAARPHRTAFASTIHDFDGDGIADVLDTTYYHVEPPWAAAHTSGLVLVRSGSNGQVLLAHATPTPLDRAHWCGDVDGNGTADVFVEDDVPLVLGFVDR